jgi:hypothetical protein
VGGPGIQGINIHAALVRQYGFGGSYSAVERLIRQIRAAAPPRVTSRLTFAPGEAAQVDFGAGPLLADPLGSEGDDFVALARREVGW